MPYWQLFYHLVWATHRRQLTLTSEVIPIIYGFLRAKAVGLGAQVFALDGIEDHVHLVVSIPPRIAVAKFVGQVKAVASTKFNKQYPDYGRFAWQAEYGAFSFDAKRLPYVVAYVERQREHHAEDTVIPVLERMEDMSIGQAREQAGMYAEDEARWLREMRALG